VNSHRGVERVSCSKPKKGVVKKSLQRTNGAKDKFSAKGFSCSWGNTTAGKRENTFQKKGCWKPKGKVPRGWEKKKVNRLGGGEPLECREKKKGMKLAGREKKEEKNQSTSPGMEKIWGECFFWEKRGNASKKNGGREGPENLKTGGKSENCFMKRQKGE